MNLYNMKLNLSCLKQTLTLRMVIPATVRTSEEAERSKETLAANAVAITMVIAETTNSIIIHLKENEKTVVFPIL